MMKKTLGTLFILIVLTTVLYGYIETLPLPELIKQAEYICIARVVQIKEISVNKEQVSTIKNVLSAEKIYKGKWQKNEPIVIMTKQCAPPGKLGWLEDQVTFPSKGLRVVIFFRKAPDGSLEPVNLVQGVWPMRKEDPQGMGYGITLKELEDEVNKQVK